MFGCLVTSADAADEVSAISEKYETTEAVITRATTVKTPKGSTVEWIDYSGLPQMTADEKAYYNNWVRLYDLPHSMACGCTK